MLIADTNVISELMKRRAGQDPQFALWASAHPELWVTAISVAEVMAGIAYLDEGKRKASLLANFAQLLNRAPKGSVLAFDEASAPFFGHAMSVRRAAGRPMSVADGMISAIALRHRAPLATRNVGDFEGLGLALVNPWDSA